MQTKLKSDEVLEACVASLLPLVRYCLLEGVNYPQFIKALKPIFAQAAKLELEKRKVKINDSAVSLLSGLHRKDVRELGKGGGHLIAHSGTVASLLFAKWVSDPVYVQKNGKPRRLVKNGPAPSFESLALSITQDVHPGSILRAMEGQGMLRIEGEGKSERVALIKESFIPQDDLSEMLSMFAANLHDHMSAASSNLLGGSQPFLEQAVFGDGLTQQSVAELAILTRSQWAECSLALIKRATQLCHQDKGSGEPYRFRLGHYFYSMPYSTPITAATVQDESAKSGS